MKRMCPAATAFLLACVPLAHAQSDANWQVKVGVHVVDPTADNGHLAGGALATDVGSGISPTITLEYRVTPNLGVELLAALPFSHDVKLNGTKAATAKQLPPTLSVQWHFLPDARFDPFVGVGLNYTRFFSVDEKGPLTGTQLELGDSWGAALHAGLEYAVNDRWSLTGDVRWISLSSDAKVNGAKVGTVDIDPFVYGFAIGYRF
ncbi:MAG: OmpW family outer membrane protein [Dokdonella sp.]|uniref:OmpW/AlkL family protein n=1 Tax=Dokdonella sp. TaxID=2291710 RepID=UPI003265B598